MAIAKAKGRLRGKQLKLKPSQEPHLDRSTVYRTIHRVGGPTVASPAGQASS